MNITKTSRFRLYVALSLVWVIFFMMAVEFPRKMQEFFTFTLHVWAFWASVWIWSEKFKRVFGVDDDAVKRRESKKWVYLDKETAEKSELYGVGGWAIVFLIAAAIPITLNVVLLMDLIDFLKIDESVYNVEYPGYELYSFVSNVQSWVFVALTVAVVYLLLIHNENFQRLFVILFLIGFVSDVALFIWMVNVLNYSDNDTLQASVVFKGYIGGFIWLFYVIKSKRINLTTKKRIRKKYLDLYISRNRENTVKKYD